MNKLNLQDIELKGKKVLIRVDFNVPLNEHGLITDMTRIKESLPSLLHIIKKEGATIIMSHLGRPKGKVDNKLSLEVCVKPLSEMLGTPIIFIKDCIGPEVEKAAKELKSGQVLLLENLRFYPAEENPSLDSTFAKKLSQLGDIYVNDAFGTAHRAHASTATIAQFFPKKAAAGFLMQKEIDYLGSLLKNPKLPFYAIIGGAKVSSKMGILKSLLSKVNGIFIGGGMSYTFFKAMGIKIGDSICEDSLLSEARNFLNQCKKKNIKLWLPIDLVVADSFDNHAHSKIVLAEEGIEEHWQGMDTGPKTIEQWRLALKDGATIFWNGPVGVFEFPSFAKGTESLAQSIAELPCIKVVGGGDSVSAIAHLNLLKKFSHISTGGGASLEYIEYGHLPGIDALTETEVVK